jgi:putative aldouronate transport system substrate-binding protein
MVKKRISTIILALVLCMIFSACQSGKPASTASVATSQPAATTESPVASANAIGQPNFPIVKDKINFKIMAPTQANVEDMDTNGFTKYYENLTNIHIVWQVVPEINLTDRVNISLSSGDVPDIYMNCKITQTQQAVYGKEGLFVPMNQLIDKYSLFKEIEAKVPNLESVLKMADGNIYALPYIEQCPHCEVSYKMWVNKKWMDKLGIAMPTTTEDFYNMLVAFRDKDPNGNGKADEVPLVAATDNWNSTLLNGYLTDPFVYTQFVSQTPAYLDNGKVKLSYLDPGWKDAMKWLNKLYSEKLIYSQSLTMTSDQAAQMNETGGDADIVGCMPGGTMYTAVSGTSKRFLDYVAIPPLQGPAGRLVTWDAYSQVDPTAFIITKKCANPDAAFRWGEGMYNLDVYYNRAFGVEGINWKKLKPGETNIKDLRTGDPAQAQLYIDGVQWGDKQNFCWRGLGTECDTSYFKEIRYAQLQPGSYDTDCEWRLAGDTVNNYQPYRPDIKMVLPPLVYTEQQAADVANIETVVKSYREEMAARFITGDANIDTEWDNYIKEMNVKGADKLTQIYQDAYDAKYGNK